jgi:hypothetical protein
MKKIALVLVTAATAATAAAMAASAYYYAAMVTTRPASSFTVDPATTAIQLFVMAGDAHDGPEFPAPGHLVLTRV